MNRYRLWAALIGSLLFGVGTIRMLDWAIRMPRGTDRYLVTAAGLMAACLCFVCLWIAVSEASEP